MREKINLQELTTLLSDKAGISKKDADAFLREFFDLMTDALIEDKQVKIRNLGTFKLIDVEDRESVNVRTGERVLIPAHTKVSFIQDKMLSNVINIPQDSSEPETIEEASSIPETIINTPEDEDIKPEQSIIPDIEIKEDEVSEEVAGERKKRVKIIFFTFLTIALMLVVFYFLSREDKDITNYSVQPSPKTAFDLAQEKENSKNKDYAASGYRYNGDSISPADTVMPIKQSWVPGKKRKTKIGERLTMISLEEYGDVVFWVYIYEENKHLISKDNYVKSGVNITIPPPEKYGIDAKDPKSLQKARDFAKNYNKGEQE